MLEDMLKDSWREERGFLTVQGAFECVFPAEWLPDSHVESNAGNRHVRHRLRQAHRAWAYSAVPMSLLPAPGHSVLRERNFALYLSARLLSTLAVQMQSVAIGWQVYQLTGSLVNLGLVG